MENMVSGQNEMSTLSQNHIFWCDNSIKPVTSSLPIIHVLFQLKIKQVLKEFYNVDLDIEITSLEESGSHADTIMRFVRSKYDA